MLASGGRYFRLRVFVLAVDADLPSLIVLNVRSASSMVKYWLPKRMNYAGRRVSVLAVPIPSTRADLPGTVRSAWIK